MRTFTQIIMHPPNTSTCSHLDQIRNVQPSGTGCADCIVAQGTWVQLRMCMVCGHVGCCDASQRHAALHFRATQHPICRSIEPGEEWGWCYIDQLWFAKLPLPR